jgi:hypothetical protein
MQGVHFKLSRKVNLPVAKKTAGIMTKEDWLELAGSRCDEPGRL